MKAGIDNFIRIILLFLPLFSNSQNRAELKGLKKLVTKEAHVQGDSTVRYSITQLYDKEGKCTAYFKIEGKDTTENYTYAYANFGELKASQGYKRSFADPKTAKKTDPKEILVREIKLFEYDQKNNVTVKTEIKRNFHDRIFESGDSNTVYTFYSYKNGDTIASYTESHKKDGSDPVCRVYNTYGRFGLETSRYIYSKGNDDSVKVQNEYSKDGKLVKENYTIYIKKDHKIRYETFYENNKSVRMITYSNDKKTSYDTFSDFGKDSSLSYNENDELIDTYIHHIMPTDPLPTLSFYGDYLYPYTSDFNVHFDDKKRLASFYANYSSVSKMYFFEYNDKNLVKRRQIRLSSPNDKEIVLLDTHPSYYTDFEYEFY